MAERGGSSPGHRQRRLDLQASGDGAAARGGTRHATPAKEVPFVGWLTGMDEQRAVGT